MSDFETSHGKKLQRDHLVLTGYTLDSIHKAYSFVANIVHSRRIKHMNVAMVKPLINFLKRAKNMGPPWRDTTNKPLNSFFERTIPKVGFHLTPLICTANMSKKQRTF